MPKTRLESRRPTTPGEYGSALLASSIPGGRFPFPKSLYAVEDALRFFVADKPDAVVIDFFCRLRNDRPRRDAPEQAGRWPTRSRSRSRTTRSSADEQKALREKGFAPATPSGSGGHLRVHHQAAHRGRDHRARRRTASRSRATTSSPTSSRWPTASRRTSSSSPSPTKRRCASRRNREFAKIAPLLWMRAGSRGRRIDDISAGWDVADTYGVLADLDQTDDVPQGGRGERRRRDRVHRHRRGPAVRVDRPRAARPRRAGAALRGVPAQLRDRGRAGLAVKFT